jgi:hypothetical protein
MTELSNRDEMGVAVSLITPYQRITQIENPACPVFAD